MSSFLCSKLIDLGKYRNVNWYLKHSTNPKLDRCNLYNEVTSFENISWEPHHHHFHTVDRKREKVLTISSSINSHLFFIKLDMMAK